MSEIVLLVGLPGCGKTTLLCEMCRDGWLVFDDFKAAAFDNSPRFSNSRKFRTLMSAIHDGLRCAVADIDFCKEHSRAEAESAVRAAAPHGATLDWRYFENDPLACEANIRSRQRPSIQTDLEKLREYTALYRIPQGAVVLPIRR